MLYLNKGDIQSLIIPNEVIDILEEGYRQYEAGLVDMPERINVFDGENIFAYMPCFTSDYKGTKILTMYPGNRKYNVPLVQGVMLLNDAKTGTIQCILDGAALTVNRTGAAGAVGVKHTSSIDCSTLGIIGAGEQGLTQCVYSSKVRNIKSISVLDVNKQRAIEFCQRLWELLPDIEITAREDVQSLLSHSEIIITTTTSTQPVLPDCKELLQGKHFIGIGSYKPNMREYPKSLFEELEHLYIDAEYAKMETGDIVIPLREAWLREEQVLRLGQGITDNNIKTDGTTFFKSVGMSLFDLLVAQYLHKKAIEQGIGQRIQA